MKTRFGPLFVIASLIITALLAQPVDAVTVTTGR
jgi:hypothetical protein